MTLYFIFLQVKQLQRKGKQFLTQLKVAWPTFRDALIEIQKMQPAAMEQNNTICLAMDERLGIIKANQLSVGNALMDNRKID